MGTQRQGDRSSHFLTSFWTLQNGNPILTNDSIWCPKPAPTNLERHLVGEEVSKCPLGTQCSARQTQGKAEGYSHFYKLLPYANSEEINTNLHSFVKIEAEFSSSHIFSKYSFVSVQVKDNK